MPFNFCDRLYVHAGSNLLTPHANINAGVPIGNRQRDATNKTTTVITLLLAMRNEGFIDAFSCFVSLRANLKIVGDCSSVLEVEQLFCQSSPDILLIDARFGSDYNFNLIAEIVKKHQDAKIIGTTIFFKPDVETALIKAGAYSYMARSDEMEVMQSIIETVNAGQKLFGEKLAQLRKTYSSQFNF